MLLRPTEHIMVKSFDCLCVSNWSVQHRKYECIFKICYIYKADIWSWLAPLITVMLSQILGHRFLYAYTTRQRGETFQLIMHVHSILLQSSIIQLSLWSVAKLWTGADVRCGMNSFIKSRPTKHLDLMLLTLHTVRDFRGDYNRLHALQKQLR